MRLSYLLPFVGLFAFCFPASAAEEAPLVNGLRDLKKLNRQLTDMAPVAKQATVALISKGGNGTGSGVIVSEDGLVLTAAHVMAALGEEVLVILPDGTRLNAEKLGADFDRDAAMVKITDKGPFPHVEVGDGERLRRNEWCVAMGHPGGFDPTRTPPLRLGRVLFDGPFVVTDCAVVGGDSGGPLFDSKGHLIGIHSNIGATLSENRHVPISVFLDQWDDMLAGKRSGKRFAGETQPKTPPIASRPVLGVKLGDGSEKGVEVTGVVPDSPAEEAGLKAGDVIISIGNKKVSTPDELIGAVSRSKPGQQVKLIVLSDGKEETFKVKLAKLGDLMEQQPRDAEESEVEEKAKVEAQDELAEEAVPDEELEARMMELFQQALRNRGNLMLSPEEAEQLGGLEKVRNRIAEIARGMDPEKLKELVQQLGAAAEDLFFASSMKALKPVIKKSEDATAVVMTEGKAVALGTFVNEKGWMLTKDTETLESEVKVVWNNETLDARLLKRFPEHDLALYSVDGGSFPPVVWASMDKMKLGSLLAVPDGENQPIGIGLVSVMPRRLAEIGFLGVAFANEEDGGVLINQVVPRSGAAEAGLKSGDRILKLNGEQAEGAVEFGSKIRTLRTGETIKLEVDREGELLQVEVTLGERPQASQGQRFRKMNEMSGPLSKKTGGFPAALQHDIPLDPELCGGPLLDLQGRCVGINVARAGRVETYAIPADEVQRLLAGVDEEEITEEDLKAVRELIREVQGNLSELQERLELLEAR